MKIILDAIEEKVKTLLLQYSREFTQRGNPELTLRFTGGWVRDKLLNRQSHDIDVALDKTTGEEFAAGLHNFMVDRGISETGVHKIAVNPEKSKHLETATTRIYGLDIDFVNLRSEEYANQDSRVPTTVKFGTPSEDAFRRDATLNALFYNLSTEMVEDFTGKGVSDLESGILRTPLDPKETFSDDPLRVMRLLRFVGQLGFIIAQDTLDAMRGESIGSKLATKVSGERIGTEMLKLLQSNHVSKALNYFIDLGLGPFVFRVNDKIAAKTDLLKLRFDNMNQALLEINNSVISPQNANEQSILWLATLLQDMDEGDNVAVIIQDGLRLTKLIKDGGKKLVSSIAPFDKLYEKFKSGTVTRTDMGLYVRSLGPYWKISLALNASRVVVETEKNCETVLKLANAIIDAGLDNAYELKPIVAGKELMSLLNRKPGPWMQPALQREIEYMIETPQYTKESVLEWAKSEL